MRGEPRQYVGAGQGMCNVVALCLAFPMTVTGKVQKYLNLPL
jgi:hypothetical protein